MAASAEGLLVTDGHGAVWTCDDHRLTLRARGGPAWDNHLVAL